MGFLTCLDVGPKQRAKVKVNVLIAQSCPILCNRMDFSQPGSYIHGILQARVPEWVAIPFPRGIFPIQGSNPGLLNRKQILYYLSHQGSPKRGKGR